MHFTSAMHISLHTTMANSFLLSLFIIISSSFVITLSQSSTTERCIPSEKKILLQIKNQLGPKAYFFDTWHPNTDCCRTWWNVACDDRTNRVNYLTIGQTSEISGEIPTIVGDLTALEVLYFNDLPGLTGQIPTSISKLINLRDLELFRTNLTGQIPGYLGRFKKLTTLDLSKNYLSGPIPASIGLLTNLHILALDNNQLSGPIPDSFGSFKNLVFRAQDNRLSSPIPKSLSRAGFYYVNVSNNELTGDASVLFGKGKGLVFAQLKNNALSFDLSKVEFPSGLYNLDLSHNKIYGSLPEQLAKLPLRVFDVSYNKLCGPVPGGDWVTRFGADAFGHNKCLCGAPLPACK